jgi:transposase
MVYGTVIQRPDSRQNLCLDNGYAGQKARQTIESADYVPHVRGRSAEREGQTNIPGYKPRRWIVEVAHSWFNRFRKLLVRFEKKACTHIALLHLAAAIIAFRKANVIYE